MLTQTLQVICMKDITKLTDAKTMKILFMLKFLYEKSGNTYLDKLFCLYKLKKSFDRYNICFIHSEKEYNLIKDVFKILLTSNFISNTDNIMI